MSDEILNSHAMFMILALGLGLLILRTVVSSDDAVSISISPPAITSTPFIVAAPTTTLAHAASPTTYSN